MRFQEAYAEFLGFRQRTGTTELDYGSKVCTLPTRCGNVLGPSRLKPMYTLGVNEADRWKVGSHLGNNQDVEQIARARYAQSLGETYRHGSKPQCVEEHETIRTKRLSVLMIGPTPTE